ncbi:hypothetical protein FWK35_00009930, partial [Aphis craccivora]
HMVLSFKETRHSIDFEVFYPYLRSYRTLKAQIISDRNQFKKVQQKFLDFAVFLMKIEHELDKLVDCSEYFIVLSFV